MSQPIIETATVRLDADLGSTKDEVIRSLAGALVDAGRAGSDVEALLSRVVAAPHHEPGARFAPASHLIAAAGIARQVKLFEELPEVAPRRIVAQRFARLDPDSEL